MSAPLRHTLVLLSLLAVAAPLHAELRNPAVQLKLEGVTCREACEALSRAAGVDLRLQPPPAGNAALDHARLEARRDFDWRGVTLANALRQLYIGYGLRSTRHSNRYDLWLVPPDQARTVSTEAPVVFTGGGVRIALDALGFAGARPRGAARPARAGADTLQVLLKIDPGAHPVERFWAFTNSVALDDQGHYLAGIGEGVVVPGTEGTGSALPDRAGGLITLDAPHPNAQKLRWLETELYAWEPVEPKRGEMVWPANPEQPLRFGDTVIEDVRLITEAGQRSLKYRTVYPTDRQLGFPNIEVTIVGVSGKAYETRGGGGSARTIEGEVIAETSAILPPFTEPIARLRFTRWPQPNLKKISDVRISDIALPHADNSLAYGSFLFDDPGAAAATGGGESPLFQHRGGATLTSRVILAGKPVRDGSVGLGLSVREGEGWSPVRWKSVGVDARGEARLPNLPPGRYRVLRAYRAARPTAHPGPGSWNGTEQEVTVGERGTVRLADLAFVPGGASTAADGAENRVSTAGPFGDVAVSLSAGAVDARRFRVVRAGDLEPATSLGGASLRAELSMAPRGVSARQLRGIVRLCGKDDLGNIVYPVAYASRVGVHVYAPSAQPAQASLILGGTDPRARRLAWLEGEVVGAVGPPKTVTEIAKPAPAEVDAPVNDASNGALDRVFTFRIENVRLPVPQAPAFTPRRVRPPRFDPAVRAGPGSPAAPRASPAPHALYRAHGGTVSLTGGGRELAGATVLLGFAALDAGSDRLADRAYRWIEITLDDRGAGMLPEVAPGRYRVRRVLQGREPSPPPTAEVSNTRDTIELRVEAGKTALLPVPRRARQRRDRR